MVREGSLILNNLQELPTELLPEVANLLTTNTYTPISRPGEPKAEPRSSQARILIVSEKADSQIERCIGHVMKVPPLRVRKADIKAQVEYYISLYSRARGLSKPHITPEALRRLQTYDFPGNLKELKNLVERAIVQVGEGKNSQKKSFGQPNPRKSNFALIY